MTMGPCVLTAILPKGGCTWRCQNGSSSALNPRNQVQAGISGLGANPGRRNSTRQGLPSARRLMQPLGKNWPLFPPKFLPSADFSELGSRVLGPGQMHTSWFQTHTCHGSLRSLDASPKQSRKSPDHCWVTGH